jgi:hypothetical protein
MFAMNSNLIRAWISVAMSGKSGTIHLANGIKNVGEMIGMPIEVLQDTYVVPALLISGKETCKRGCRIWSDRVSPCVYSLHQAQDRAGSSLRTGKWKGGRTKTIDPEWCSG